MMEIEANQKPSTSNGPLNSQLILLCLGEFLPVAGRLMHYATHIIVKQLMETVIDGVYN